MLDNLTALDDRLLWILLAAAIVVNLLILEKVMQALTRRYVPSRVGFQHPAEQ
jgi:hypothetical protein